MPQCRKCGKVFPNRLEVAGKMRVVSNRKYCLDCSPYGLHNTRKVEFARCDRCSLCERRPTNKGNRICGYCRNKVQRWRLKLACVEYKGGKCARCGWSGNPVAFDFHHTDPREKEFGLQMSTRSWTDIQQELDKCELLCTRCHRIEHAQELDDEFWEYVFSYRGDLKIGRSKTW